MGFKRQKKWWILVVVVKWRYHANRPFTKHRSIHKLHFFCGQSLWGIWKGLRQKLDSNATSLVFYLRNVFLLGRERASCVRPSPHYAGGIRKRNGRQPFWICVLGKLGQENRVIIMTSPFSKRSHFKMFSGHTKTQSPCFQISPVRREFSWQSSVNGGPNCGNTATFPDFFSWRAWMGP